MNPNGELVHDGDNNFYGTTSQGSGPNTGSIFRFGTAIRPKIDRVAIVTEDDINYVQFHWQGFGGVIYGIETNSSPSPTGWRAMDTGLYFLGSPTNTILQTPINHHFSIDPSTPQLFLRVTPLLP